MSPYRFKHFLQGISCFFSFVNIPNYFFPLCSLISYHHFFYFFHHFSFFSVSSFLSFVYSSSTLSFFPGSLLPGQQLCIPIVSGNKPRKKGEPLSGSPMEQSLLFLLYIHSTTATERFKPNPFAHKLHSCPNY